MAGINGPKIITRGLVLCLDAADKKSYPGSGTAWNDISGNNFVGTLVNSPTFSSDKGGKFTFNGTNQAVNLVNQNFSVSGNSARSVFCWMRSTSTAQRAFFGSGTAANSQAFNLVSYVNNAIGVMGYALDFYPGGGIVTYDGIWHFIGAVANGSSTTTTYVDGVADNSSGGLTYNTTGQNNYIAQSNHTGGNERYYNGDMAIVYYYNRALSLAEIKQNFNATRRRFNV